MNLYEKTNLLVNRLWEETILARNKSDQSFLCLTKYKNAIKFTFECLEKHWKQCSEGSGH